MEADSYVDKNGEWRTKKVSILGVVQSFVSQLKIGEDMTRVSLPALLLYPFSMLEVIALRELSTLDSLLSINQISSPLDRMLEIVSWFISTLPLEVWRKKPYNPVIGEVLDCYIETKYGKTFFVAEQVSHHPPISSVYYSNPQEQVTISENLSFGASYGSNRLSILTNGKGEINFNKINETYIFPKKVPDMAVRNLVIGSKKVFWEGDIVIQCPQSHLTATLKFDRDGDKNSVKGRITQNDKYLISVEGFVGGVVNIVNENEKKKQLLVDMERIPKAKLRFPPSNTLEPLNSIKVWEQTSKYILADKTLEADESKKKVEEDQRKRIAAEQGQPHKAAYFEYDSSKAQWVIKKDLFSKKFNIQDHGHSIGHSNVQLPVVQASTSGSVGQQDSHGHGHHGHHLFHHSHDKTELQS